MRTWVACANNMSLNTNSTRRNKPWTPQLCPFFLRSRCQLICYQVCVEHSCTSSLPASFTCRKQLGQKWPHCTTHYRNMSGCWRGSSCPSVNHAGTYDNEAHFRTLWACGGVLKVRVEGAWEEGTNRRNGDGRQVQKIGGLTDRLGGTSMHKDESTGTNVAPTNQSDIGWRAQMAWHFPNCDRNMSHIELCECVCICETIVYHYVQWYT